MKSIFSIFAGFILCVWAVAPAQAQQCEAVGEAIMNFETPFRGSYNLWDATFGSKDAPEEFVSGFLAPHGNVIVAGHRYTPMRDKKMLVIGELDRRGRDSWMKDYEIEGLEEVYKLLPVEGGFWAIGTQHAVGKKNRKHKHVWIGQFDLEGTLLNEAAIKEKHSDVVPSDLVAAHDGKGFVLSAKIRHHDKAAAQGSRIYFLNKKAKVSSYKSFVFGSDNLIESLTPLGTKRYAAVGRIRDTHRRWAGWVMVLSEDGGLEWQREYSRGAAATLTVSTEHKSGNILVGGIARPAIKDGERAGWLMSVDSARGDVAWQRYYVGKSDYVTRKILAHPDGLISALLSVGQKEGTEGELPENLPMDATAHAKLLTLSPRGQIFSDYTYFNGVSAVPEDLFLGKNDERLIVGQSKVDHIVPNEDDPEGEPFKEYSDDFWAMAGVATDPYEDPCARFISFLP